MARTYVATTDARLLDYLRQILAIRNGTSPRPERCHSIYWGLVVPSGQAPRSAEHPEALSDLLAGAGFTDRELAWLAASEPESKALADLEETAMETGHAAMLFGREYHEVKAIRSRAEDARTAGKAPGRTLTAVLGLLGLGRPCRLARTAATFPHIVVRDGGFPAQASRTNGQLMQRGPPRPRPSSDPGTSMTSIPARRSCSFVATVRS